MLYIAIYTAHAYFIMLMHVCRLWFDEFMALWIKCDSYPPWEDVSKTMSYIDTLSYTDVV